MFIGILALAMMLGGLAAAAALIAGWSFLAALALYSGGGLFSALAITLGIFAMSPTRQNRGTDLLQADVTAFN